MNEDSLLSSAMEVLDPTTGQITRVQRQIEEQLARERVSLAGEWLQLLQQRPLVNGGLVLAGACALLLTTPLGTLLWSLLRMPPSG